MHTVARALTGPRGHLLMFGGARDILCHIGTVGQLELPKRPAHARYDVPPHLGRPARSHRCASSDQQSLSCLSSLPMPTQLLLLSLFFLSTERIDASYFKALLATSKSRQTTSEDAWALFIGRCRYVDNEYSNQFNISFAIVDIKCV